MPRFSFVLLALLIAAAPARAQVDPDQLGALTPDAALAATWAEVLGGATAVSQALDDAAAIEADTAIPDDDRLGDVRAGLTAAALGSAASAGGLTAAMQFSVALADAGQRPAVFAALSADVQTLGGLLVQTAEEAVDAALAESLDELGAEGVPETWGPRAAEIRAVVGRIEGATAALGISSL